VQLSVCKNDTEQELWRKWNIFYSQYTFPIIHMIFEIKKIAFNAVSSHDVRKLRDWL
jgi:hypothetical protein